MPSYKAVIFDLDGTLIDSMNIWKQIDIEFLAKRNIIVPCDYMEAISHLCAYDTAIYTIERFNLSDTPPDLINEWIEMALCKYSEAKLKPGVQVYIDYLIKHNIQFSIATATEPQILNSALKGKSFEKDIHSIVTVSDVARGKGFPDIYEKCAENMGVLPCECIVFEDILTAVTAAKSAGFYTVAVYDECSKENAEKIKEICDKYIFSFEEMLE